MITVIEIFPSISKYSTLELNLLLE